MVPAGVNMDKFRGSLELWYRPDWDPGDATTNRPRRVLATDGRRADESGAFSLTTQGGGLGFSFWTTQHVGVGAAIGHWKKDQWHHVVVAWDGTSGMRLFLDGKPVAQCKATWTRDAAAPSQYLYLGGEWNGRQLADGWFEGLRVYDQSLTDAEVRQAFAGELHVSAAPRKAIATTVVQPLPHRAPKLLFYAPFDGDAKAATAAGRAEPLEAKNVRFVSGGIRGQCLAADEGTVLSYEAKGNLQKPAGALSLWVAPAAEAFASSGVYFGDDFCTPAPPATRATPSGYGGSRRGRGRHRSALTFARRSSGPTPATGGRGIGTIWPPAGRTGRRFAFTFNGRLAVQQRGKETGAYGAYGRPRTRHGSSSAAGEAVTRPRP